MQKWEYKTMMLDSARDELHIDGQVVARKDFKVLAYLQKLGSEGWELAGVVSECYAMAGGLARDQWTGIRWYFKRPIG
jgi:hypothetical protein